MIANVQCETPYVIDGHIVSRAGGSWVILRDVTGGIFAEIQNEDIPQPGSHVLASMKWRCVTSHGRQSTNAVIMALNCLEVDANTIRPIDVSPSDLIHSNPYDFHHVTVRGTVTEVFQDEIDPLWTIIFIEADNAKTVMPIMHVSANLPLPSDMELIDAEIAATGVFLQTPTSGRLFLGPHVVNYDGNAIKITKPAPNDPFSTCRTTDFSASDVALSRRDVHRRRTTGRVIATFGAGSAFLKLQDDKRLRVHFNDPNEMPKVNTVIDAIGFVRSNAFAPLLSNAKWRVNTKLRIPRDDCCETVLAHELLYDKNGLLKIRKNYDGRIIRLRGHVIDRQAHALGRKRLAISSDGMIINAETPFSHTPEIGSVIELTGACVLHYSSNATADFDRIEGFSIATRTPSDITVISSPPWWTVPRLILTLGLVIILMLAILVWNILLHRLAERRGQQLAGALLSSAQSELKKTERTRLSVELHDSLSQSLTGVVLQLDASQHARNTDSAAADRHLETAQRMLHGCRTELRRCIWDLRSSALDNPDFEQAIRTSLHPVTHNARLTVRSHIPRSQLSDNVAHAVLRILRELAYNSLTHGNATTIRIAGDISTGPLKFSVSDDGTGFPPTPIPGPDEGHFGLMGIRERLRDLNGTLTVENLSPSGAKVTFYIPFPSKAKIDNP